MTLKISYDSSNCNDYSQTSFLNYEITEDNFANRMSDQLMRDYMMMYIEREIFKIVTEKTIIECF